MASEQQSNWADSRPQTRLTTEQALAEERLAFTDRIIGLEQQVRELQAASVLTPSEAAAIEVNYANLQSSLTWRVGRLAMLPVRVLRYAKRRVLG
jgi:hypothetical protein